MSLRSKLLAVSTFHEKVIDLDIGTKDAPNVQKILIRSPSVAQKTAMFGDVDVADAGGKTLRSRRISLMIARNIITCALDPETKQPIFGEEDEDVILALPDGSWVTTLNNAISELSDRSESAAKN